MTLGFFVNYIQEAFTKCFFTLIFLCSFVVFFQSKIRLSKLFVNSYDTFLNQKEKKKEVISLNNMKFCFEMSSLSKNQIENSILFHCFCYSFEIKWQISYCVFINLFCQYWVFSPATIYWKKQVVYLLSSEHQTHQFLHLRKFQTLQQYQVLQHLHNHFNQICHQL
jgi:hypothetical protein